jgi:hypothetical protein
MRVRDLVRIDRREEADQDDQEKENERGKRDLVPQQPAPGEAPRTLA